MTGKEAWGIIAPILAAHSVYDANAKENGLNVIDQAYIIAYKALDEYDEARKGK